MTHGPWIISTETTFGSEITENPGISNPHALLFAGPTLALDGTVPVDLPRIPSTGDGAYDPLIVSSEWRPGQVIRLTQPALTLTVEAEPESNYSNPGVWVNVYTAETDGSSPVRVYQGPDADIPLEVAYGYATDRMIIIEIDVVHSIPGVILPLNRTVGWLGTYPDYRYIYGGVPPLHQRQRTDGLGGGPIHVGRNLNSRQLSAFQRGML